MKKKNNIIEAQELPNDEKVWMRKSMGNWRVVYPIKNEDGSVNYFNLFTGGSWFKLLAVIFIILIILGVAYEYSSNLNSCNNLMNKINNMTNIKLYPNQNTNNLNGLNLTFNYNGKTT